MTGNIREKNLTETSLVAASNSTSVAPAIPAKPKASEPRLAGLDSLRFVLAIWVYLSHFAPSFHPARGAGLLTLAAAGAVNNLFNGAAAVIGFFIISGLCIHYPYRKAASISIPQFYIRRYIRILIPFAAAIGLARLMGADLIGFYNAILWSLVAELIYYTLYPALRVAMRAWSFRTILVFSFAASGALIFSHPRWLNFHEFGPGLTWLVGLPAWLLGCHLARHPESSGEICRPEIWRWRFLVWALSAAAAVLRFHAGIGYPISLTLLAPILYLWLKKELAWHRQRGVSRIFERGGEFSYSIYLMHGLAVTVIGVLLPSTAKTFFAPVRLLFVIILSYVFFVVVERPGHSIARQLARRWRGIEREPGIEPASNSLEAVALTE
jgi:peptidoglycan/LPS O-acetylase OafA/YrhL